jgi:F0F1-type ATP synthase assembly protein I
MSRPMELKKPIDQQKATKNLKDYTRYSNLGMQMIVVIALGVFGGIKLDKWLQLKFPVFTVVLSFTGVVLGIYIGLKDFIKTKKK